MTIIRPTGTLREFWEASAPKAASVESLARAMHAFQMEPAHVWLAEHVAESQSHRDENLRFDQIIWLTLLLLARGDGSTCVDCSDIAYLVERVFGLMRAGAELGDESPEGVVRRLLGRIERGELGELASGASGFAPLILDGKSIYIEQMWRGESRLVSSIIERLCAVGADLETEEVERAIDEVRKALPFKLNEEQLQAIRTCVGSSFAVVSGGPGTGKTTGVVLSALRVFARLGFDAKEIKLAAPTGKAANRMMEAIRAGMTDVHLSDSEADRRLGSDLSDASTIHRLLGSMPYKSSFRFNARNPLKAKVVIVDEASMIDLDLMNALLDAIPLDARLILIGDPYQLPSVNTGAVFRDLVRLEEHGLAAARLEVSQRVNTTQRGGKEILDFAAGINGRDELKKPETMVGAELHGEGVRLYHGKDETYSRHELDVFLERWYDSRFDLTSKYGRLHRDRTSFQETEDGFGPLAKHFVDNIFDHYAQARLLCLTQVYSSGAQRINRFMHRRYGAKHDLTEDVWRQPTIWEGEPVMMLQNDYTLGLFNGDQGIVLFTIRPGEQHAKKRVVFPSNGNYRTVDLGLIRQSIELSYAMTIHKSQGSEYRHVGIILPPGEIPLLTREILYTGVTRAKDSVAVFGSWPLVKLASERPAKRFSGILKRIGSGIQ